MNPDANRRKGHVFERAVCLDQERMGRVAFRVRQGGGEPVDIVSIATDGPITFIQCKSGKVYLSRAERAALLAKARLAGALALLASKDKNKIKYRVLE